MIDFTSTTGQVRLLISDVDEQNQILTDDMIDGFLALAGSPRRAAADALDAIATSEALIGKVIRSQDLSTDGAKVAEALRGHARQLRAQADAEDDALAPLDVAVFEFRPYPTSYGPEAAEFEVL